MTKMPNEGNIASYYDELLCLIPAFIEHQIRDQLIEKIDLGKQSIHSKELEFANYLLSSEDLVNIHWGLNIYQRYLNSESYVKQQLGVEIVLDLRNIIPKFIQIAKISTVPLLTYEVLYILRKIIKCPRQAQHVVENQGLVLLIDQLKSPYLIIVNQAIISIEILSFNQEYKIIAQDSNVIQMLIEIIQQQLDVTFQNLEISIRALIQVSSGYIYESKGIAGLNLMKNVLTILCHQIYKSQELCSLIINCFNGIINITRLSQMSHEMLMKTGFIAYTINLIGDEKTLDISGYVLTFLNTIVEAKNSQMNNYIFEQGFVAKMILFLKQNDFELGSYLHILLNLSSEQFQHNVINNKEFMAQIFLQLQQINHHTINSLIFLHEATSIVTQKDVQFWIDQGLLDLVINLVSFPSVDKCERIITHIIYLLDAILSKGRSQQNKIFASELKKNNGINILAELQRNSIGKIAEISTYFIRKHNLL